ncbi:ABC transporter ATP-binding protein [Brevundimonas variabilis]|uniref:Capsular polysaccharide transport system ATP-binding protein n=1 Tax=Brevundimonas variabilis TaxID=74312 RepID=A0A7W9CH82_9CAUL|nr:ABC transporter ATP-binding protein [Brevundimonas variabilis]MBB5745338.1 capsular polysaccharide transport system ATP-binding protein [Brevundimonas variabilis]
MTHDALILAPPAPPGLRVADVSKTYPTGHRPVFSGLNFDLDRSGRLAILGRNGQGKSTLIKMLGGVLPPTSGQIDWQMTASWPIGFGGAFQGSLSGLDNIKFLSRLYQRPIHEMIGRVDDFAELGRSLRLPVKHYSSGMRARLAFGLSLAIEFDCYLIDELMAVGDARFAQKCQDELFTHRGDRAFLMASHDTNMIAHYCDRALIIESGKAKIFEDVHEAVDIYTWLRAA